MSQRVVFGTGQIAAREGAGYSKFRTSFGDMSTPVWSAIETTVQWYRNNPAKEAS